MGPRVGHSEECRVRIEQAIAKDVGDERSNKAKERIDHYIAQRVEAGDEDRSAQEVNDPRGSEPTPAADEERSAPQEFDIGCPGKEVRMDGADDLDDGPIAVSERRFRTPVRAPLVKRKKNIHDGAGHEEDHHRRDE